jgi:hypothetical protein
MARSSGVRGLVQGEAPLQLVIARLDWATQYAAAPRLTTSVSGILGGFNRSQPGDDSGGGGHAVLRYPAAIFSARWNAGRAMQRAI